MFDVFVSYAHEDVGLARALASGLSRVGKPWWRRRSLHVFRDETVMTASADLWDSIRGPLEDSAFFVSIISPAAAASPWVTREIDWWVSNRGDDHLLVVLADGTCDWDPDRNDWSPTATAIPPPLRGAFDGEPRWVDATWTATSSDLTRRDGRFLDLLAELAAPVQHTTKDAIVGEELKQHRRTVRTVTAAATLLFLLAVAAIIGAVVALDQRDQAEHRRQQALSQSLAGQAAELATSRPDLGILLAVEAWNHANTPQAEQALITAAQSTLTAAQRFRGPDNGAWLLELVSVPEHGYALAGRIDGSLTLWKLPATAGATGATLAAGTPKPPAAPKSPHTASIAALVRDAAGTRVVSVDVKGGVAVWDAATLSEPTTFTVPTDGQLVVSAGLSDDGRTLMVSTAGGPQLWDLDQQAPLAALPSLTSAGTVSHAAMSRDGTHVAASLVTPDANAVIAIWDVGNGTVQEYALSSLEIFVEIAFSNDGNYLGAVSVLGASEAYRVRDGSVAARFSPELGTTTLTGGVLGGIVAVNDHAFVTANGSANTLVWDAATQQILATYPVVLGGSPSALALSGNAIVAADVAGTMSWVPFGLQTSDGLAARVGRIPAGSRFGTSAAPDTLLTSLGDRFTLWDARTQRSTDSFAALRADGALPAFSTLDAAARRVALGYADGTLEIRDARSGRATATIPRIVASTPIVSFAGDRLVVVPDTTVDPAAVLVVSPDGSRQTLWRAPPHRRITALATSGDAVAVGLDDGRLVVWDSVQRSAHRELDLGAVPAWRIAFAPSGGQLVVGDGGGRLHVIDTTGRALRQVRDAITTDHGPVIQMGFSDTNRVLAVSPILVAYADLATGNMLAANITPTRWLSIAPVEHGFITVDPDGALMRWRFDPSFLLSKLCPVLDSSGAVRDGERYLGTDATDVACPAK